MIINATADISVQAAKACPGQIQTQASGQLNIAQCTPVVTKETSYYGLRNRGIRW